MWQKAVMIEQHNDLTLEEISAATTVSIRTLRSWIDEGLLDPPDKSGRGARYPRENVDRALAVLALKAQKQSLKEIAEAFFHASPADFQQWAAEAPTPPANLITSYMQENLSPAARGTPVKSQSRFDLEDPAVAASMSPEKRDYLRRKHMQSGGRPDKPRTGGRDRREEEITAIENLIPELERILGSLKPPRRVRSEPWIRLPVTFGLELSVRGDLSPRERHVFEQFAGELRALLRKRDPDERTELYPDDRR
jgi:DNA-binding transcriptional MerR regulator